MTDNIQITELTAHSEMPKALLDLYREAFPPEERRAWTDISGLKGFMLTHPQMYIRIIEADREFAGFMIYWHLSPALRYVEHLATLSQMRGKGLGARLIESLKSEPDSLILLEVEPPKDELTRRRVRFYRRLGLVLHDSLPYTQPPYCAGLPSVDLCLMTSPQINDCDLATNIVPMLYSSVYGLR